MEVSQEVYHTAQFHSCPKGWENEQALLAFAVFICKQDRIQSIKSTVGISALKDVS